MLLIALGISVSMVVYPPDIKEKKLDVFEETEEIVEEMIELEEEKNTLIA